MAGVRLEEGMATHSSILAWRIPWKEEPGGLQSMGSQRVGHDCSDWACTHVVVVVGVWRGTREGTHYFIRHLKGCKTPFSMKNKSFPGVSGWEPKLYFLKKKQVKEEGWIKPTISLEQHGLHSASSSSGWRHSTQSPALLYNQLPQSSRVWGRLSLSGGPAFLLPKRAPLRDTTLPVCEGKLQWSQSVCLVLLQHSVGYCKSP